MEPAHPALSVARQCELLGVSRSSYYYAPAGISDDDLRRMRLMDEAYLRHPHYGARSLQGVLADAGLPACRAHVRRLMRAMGLAALYPKPRLSANDGGNRVYPYLLKDVALTHPDQVWASDITYIPLRHGFAYLVAVMDWASRYVVSWELSLSLETDFCVRALERALAGGRPEIFNTDQGSQFTSRAFTERLLSAGVAISMDGKGRCFDNILTERLWWSVKYEDVYLKNYATYFEANEGLEGYFRFYNEERKHTGLQRRTPSSVYGKDRPREVWAG